MKKSTGNEFRLILLTMLLGAFCGAVVWLFLRLLGICTDFIWETVPAKAGFRYLPVLICTAGGLAAGLVRRKYGDYPEELPVVLGKVRKEKHYDYSNMLVILVCAFLPLVFGSSVGPEAGLTGIIAGLCYWVGDNVKYAKEHAEEYSEIGAAVTLGSLFHMPLFGIFAVEEDPEDGSEKTPVIPKASKLLLYGLSIGSAYLMTRVLNSLLGDASLGFPSFDYAEPAASDFAMMLIYIPLGIILFKLFGYAEKITGKAAEVIPAVASETICGAVIGLMSVFVPMVIFSGEEQMGELPSTFMNYAPLALVGICVLKLFMTAFCIRFGLKGGHFFPLIFACSCMGFAVAVTVFGSAAGITDAAVLTGHAVFAAAVITAATLGAQMKQPIAVSMLLLICFPLRFVLWVFIAAALAGKMAGRKTEKSDE